MTTLRAILPPDALARYVDLRRQQNWSEDAIGARIDQPLREQIPAGPLVVPVLCGAVHQRLRCLQVKGHSGSHEGSAEGLRRPRRWPNRAA